MIHFYLSRINFRFLYSDLTDKILVPVQLGTVIKCAIKSQNKEGCVNAP
jgi:hypothetical protein